MVFQFINCQENDSSLQPDEVGTDRLVVFFTDKENRGSEKFVLHPKGPQTEGTRSSRFIVNPATSRFTQEETNVRY